MLRDRLASARLGRRLQTGEARFPLARWFYGPDQLERAKHRMRYGFASRFQKWLLNFVGGKASPPPRNYAS
jgi:hypothetical protein